MTQLQKPPAFRLDSIDVRSRSGRVRAVQEADAALSQGEHAFAAEVCRRVLAIDLENADAYAVLQCALVESQKLAEATVVANRTLQHFRTKDQGSSTAHALQVLRARGFRPNGVLDIGAYEGEFAVLARQVFPEVPLLMVEPQQQKQRTLLAMASALGGDAQVASVLLGKEERAEVSFFLMRTPYGSTGSSIYEEASEHARDEVRLPMTTLDALLRRLPGRSHELVKIDVQGAELDVLAGGPQAVRAAEVFVVELSLHVVNHGAPLLAEVVAAFDRLGFAPFDLCPLPRGQDGLLRQVDGVFVKKGSPLWQEPGPTLRSSRS